MPVIDAPALSSVGVEPAPVEMCRARGRLQAGGSSRTCRTRRAPRREPTARRRVQQRRRLAGDLGRAARRAVDRAGPATRAAPRCRDAAGRRRCRRACASSTIWPAYITKTRSATSATTPRSWVISTTARSRSRLRSVDQPQDLRLHRDVERGRRLVGDQHVGLQCQRHRDHHALPHAAGELVRVAAHPALGIRNTHRPQQLDRARQRLLLGDVAVRPDHLGDLIADAVHGVQRRHRVLEHHRDLARRGCRAGHRRRAG